VAISKLDNVRKTTALTFHPTKKMAAVASLNCFFIYSLWGMVVNKEGEMDEWVVYVMDLNTLILQFNMFEILDFSGLKLFLT